MSSVANGRPLIAAHRAMLFDYGVADGAGLSEVSDGCGLVSTLASGEAVGPGAAASVFRSHATSIAAPVKMQMYFFI